MYNNPDVSAYDEYVYDVQNRLEDIYSTLIDEVVAKLAQYKNSGLNKDDMYDIALEAVRDELELADDDVEDAMTLPEYLADEDECREFIRYADDLTEEVLGKITWL